MATNNANFKVKNGLDAVGDITTAADFKSSSTAAGAPSFNSYSAGVRTILYDNVGAASAGYTTGINSGEFWHTTSDTTGSFKWYGGVTLAATLTGTGALTTVGDITAGNNLRSSYSSGDEGGQIFLNKSVTNTTINSGVNIDVYQNKLRIWEDGGTNRGVYIDITSAGAGVGTNLLGTSTDTNYYPSAIVFNAGTTAGPTLDLTMSGTGAPDLTAVAIPSAGASASGVVTTGSQTFAGAKTFSSAVTAAGLTLSSTTSPITLNASVGTSGQVLTSAGAGATPTWTNVSYAGGTLTSGLVLATGTTSLQPLKFVAGTNLTNPATGVKEYDGTVFYSTANTNPGRALETQSYYYASSSNYSMDFSGSGAAQSMLGGASTGITVAAGTTYEFELDAALQHQYVANTGITGTFSMVNSGGALAAYTAFIDYGTNTTSFTTATTMSSIRTTGNVTFMAAISSGSRYGIIKVRGLLRITGSGTTKIYPAISTSSTNDNSWTVQSGLVFKMTPIGNGTVTSVGTWA